MRRLQFWPRLAVATAIATLIAACIGSERPAPATATAGTNQPTTAEPATTPAGVGPASRDATTAAAVPDVAVKPESPQVEFDHAAAAAALSAAATQASSCRQPGGPQGTTNVTVVFAPSGRALSATISGVFAGTATGVCVVVALRRTRIAPFSGERLTLTQEVIVN